MQTSPFRIPLYILAISAGVSITGCGMATSGAGAPSGSLVRTVNGSVHGGQQPISSAQIALYAAGTTGIASAARSMLTAPVSTDANGHFSITALYSCNPGEQVYIVATGGDAGAGVNPAIALMAALGPCATLQANAATIHIDVDELTTVASVFSLAPFMTGIQNVGADSAHANALAAAFATTQTMVNLSTGQSFSTSTGNGIVPLATIDSLANSIANCINSTAGSNACPSLFNATQGSGGTPSDTIAATLDVALNPAANPSGVFLQASATPPFQPTLTSAPASYSLTVQHPSDVLLYHNDIARSGAQTYEPTLTPANVNSTQFGKLFNFTVDSYLFAQPLYAGGLGMPDGQVHNILFAASSHGTVYAFDADGNNPSSGYLWSVSYIPSGERYAQASDYFGCTNPNEAGIVGTPVIDRASQTMYFVTKSITTTGSTFHHRLHAVSLIDGSEQPGSPQIISPSFAGTGDGTTGTVIPFNAQTQNNRSALLLTTGASGAKTVWIAYASHCDIGPYHGLLLGYNGASLALTAAFNNTPNAGDGGIWGSSGGPAADAQGNVYVLGGNGGFDANTSGQDYGDSALKLVPPATGAPSNLMSVADYFTPSNQQTLQERDLDLGGGEPLLFTDPASGVAPSLLVASDKNGYIYLIDAANFGKYNTGSNGIDGLNGDLQDFGGNGSFVWNFAFFDNTLFTGNPLRAYAYTPGTSTTAGSFNTTPVASQGDGGVAPVVSANGTSNAILWLQDQNAEMRATSVPGLTELYNTSMNSSRDAAPTYVKFTSPVVADGKVFLSGQGSIAVYGLLP
jgi:hypothetical protein